MRMYIFHFTDFLRSSRAPHLGLPHAGLPLLDPDPRQVEALQRLLRRTVAPRGRDAGTVGKPWENHGKTVGKWWFHGIFWGFLW